MKIIKKLKSTTIKNRLSPIVETINEKPETINKTNGKIEVSSNLRFVHFSPGEYIEETGEFFFTSNNPNSKSKVKKL